MRFRRFALMLPAGLTMLFALAGIPDAALLKGARVPETPALKDMDGSVFGPEEFVTGRLLVCFFSMHTPDAGAQMELLERLHEVSRSTRSGARVVAVNMDPSADAVRRFLNRRKVTFRVLPDLSLSVSDAFHVRQAPVFFFLDSGRVDGVYEGWSTAAGRRVSARFTGWGGGAAPAKNGGKNGGRVMASGNARQSRFSPADPGLLFYVSSNKTLWAYDIVTKQRAPLAEDVASFDVSPDGGLVVFASDEKPGLWIRGVERGNPRRIGNAGARPLWSPRGGRIAFLVAPDQVWVYDVGSEKHWRVDARGTEAQWSGDGQHLLVRDAKNRLWIVSPNSQYSAVKEIFRK